LLGTTKVPVKTLGGKIMHLRTPSYATFLISFILAALVILSKYFGISVPILTDIVRGNYLEIMLVAYILLFLGVVTEKL